MRKTLEGISKHSFGGKRKELTRPVWNDLAGKEYPKDILVGF